MTSPRLTYFIDDQPCVMFDRRYALRDLAWDLYDPLIPATNPDGHLRLREFKAWLATLGIDPAKPWSLTLSDGTVIAARLEHPLRPLALKRFKALRSA